MSRCAIYHEREAIWAWQPFGPDENPLGSFTELGSHYRGFPVIKVSDEAKQDIQAGKRIEFAYKGQRYITTPTGIEAVSR